MRILILPLLFFVHSNENAHPEANRKKRDAIDSVVTRISKTLGGCLLYSSKDLLAFGIKSCMNQYIGNHYSITCGPIDVHSSSLIDYGFEAALAGYSEGVHKIPHRLLSYAFADLCYAQLSIFCEHHNIEFYSLIECKPLRYILIILEPLLARRLIIYALDQLVFYFLHVLFGPFGYRYRSIKLKKTD